MNTGDSNAELKIFLVDDDTFNLKVTKFHLNRMGYKDVTIFTNGSDCINNLMHNPDVVLLDQYMEGLQGVDVLIKIRQFNPEIVIIMLSAEDDDQVADFFKQQGAFEYVIKGNNDTLIKINAALDKIKLRT